MVTFSYDISSLVIDPNLGEKKKACGFPGSVHTAYKASSAFQGHPSLRTDFLRKEEQTFRKEDFLFVVRGENKEIPIMAPMPLATLKPRRLLALTVL